MRLKKKPKDRVAVALVLTFSVVAIASIFTLRSSLDQFGTDHEDQINIAQEDNEMTGEYDVIKPVPTVDSTKQNQNESEGDSGQDVQKNSGKGQSNFTPPLKGEIIKGFSLDVPIYSKTLDQFIVHEGVDIKASLDTQVVAAAEGTITKVYTDDKLGITIEITHGDGTITRYANLSTTKMVGEGDVVKQGCLLNKESLW
jgi:murein DD-endopeptidase MepM/ murein hydrolase activator NlpD